MAKINHRKINNIQSMGAMGGNGAMSIAGVPQHNGADMARAIQTGIVPGAQGVIAGQRPLGMPGMHHHHAHPDGAVAGGGGDDGSGMFHQM